MRPLAELARRLPRDGAVLDVGCGNFERIYRNLAHARSDLSVAGLERYEDGSIYGDLPIHGPCLTSRFKRYACNIERDRFPFADESFDGAYLSHVIEHVVDKGRVLAEIRRVLKKGGVLYVETPGPNSLTSHWPVWLPHGPFATLNYYDDKTHVEAPMSMADLRGQLAGAGLSVVATAPVRELGLIGTPVYLAMIGVGALPFLPPLTREFLYGAGVRNLVGWAVSALAQK